MANAMTPVVQRALLDLEIGLKEAQYTPDLIKQDYQFVEFHGNKTALGHAPLAAFAQDPPTYRNACIGVAIANGVSGIELVSQFRSLGAPLVYELDGALTRRWKIVPNSRPELLERINSRDLPRHLQLSKDLISPSTIYGRKLGDNSGSVQLDFVDLGLLPALEHEVKEKLDHFLRRIASSARESFESNNISLKTDELFRTLFKFIAAKVIVDKEGLSPESFPDSDEAVRLVEKYYEPLNKQPELRFADQSLLDQIWSEVKYALHFKNLSVDDLAFVYENTFITKNTRSEYGTHSTPPHVAEYMVRRLPLQELPIVDLNIVEPCSGHGIFLISALRRLKEMGIPKSLVGQDVDGLGSRLIGLELDAFAREVSKLCLMLADYPYKDGWQIYEDDVFLTRQTERFVSKTSAVICNPPFGAFDHSDVIRYGQRIRRPHKPAELLERMLIRRPAMLSFVVPLTCVIGQNYRWLQSRLVETYGEIDLVRLPDKVFHHADEETVLVTAWGSKSRTVNVSSRRVQDTASAKTELALDGTGVAERQVYARDVTSGDERLWASGLFTVWRSLSRSGRLGDQAQFQRGVEWISSVPRTDRISEDPVDGWSEGFVTTKNVLSQYSLGQSQYMNVSPDVVRFNVLDLPWRQPKVFVNAVASSRNMWRLSAAVDLDGAYATQAFHFVKTELPVDVCAAVLNGPVANAWVYDWDNKRHNKVNVCEQIPLPTLSNGASRAVQHFSSMIAELAEVSGSESVCDDYIKVVDSIVLHGYGLTQDQEKYLTGLFGGSKRPTLFEFTGFDDRFWSIRGMVPELVRRYEMLDEYQTLTDMQFSGGLNEEDSVRRLELKDALEQDVAFDWREMLGP